MGDDKLRTTRSGERHAYGFLRTVMLTAMHKLGGEGTVDQLIHVCRSDAGIQERFGAKFVRTTTRVPGTFKELPLWEWSILTNMSTVFDAAGVRRGKKVFSLPASAANTCDESKGTRQSRDYDGPNVGD